MSVNIGSMVLLLLHSDLIEILVYGCKLYIVYVLTNIIVFNRNMDMSMFIYIVYWYYIKC